MVAPLPAGVAEVAEAEVAPLPADVMEVAVVVEEVIFEEAPSQVGEVVVMHEMAPSQNGVIVVVKMVVVEVAPLRVRVFMVSSLLARVMARAIKDAEIEDAAKMGEEESMAGKEAPNVG